MDEPERHAGLRSFAALLGLAALLLALASGRAALLVALATWLEGSDAWRHPVRWLASLDNADALALLAGSAQVVAGVLAILITVVAIVVELAANRYTHRITELFVRDRVNVAVMALFVLTTVLCVWLAVALSGTVDPEPLLPRGGFLLTMGMITACLLMLLPYFAYVFHFVSPLEVIRRIRSDVLTRVRNASERDVRETKRTVMIAVEELEDIARGAMQHSDRGIALA